MRSCRAWLLGAVLLLLAGCASSAPAAPALSVGQQLDAPPASAVRDAALVTSTGQPLTLASLRGKVVVISDMMTLCQETCPLDTANLVAAARAVSQAGLGNRVEFLSITIDPARDSVDRLAIYRRLFEPAPPDWEVATGSAAALQTFWRDLGVYIQKTPDTPPAPKDWLTGKPLTYDLTHSDEVFFLDRRGAERFVLDGAPHLARGATIPPQLAAFLDAQGRQHVTNPAAGAWTLPQELSVVSWLTGKSIK